jgi:hypothetical protein
MKVLVIPVAHQVTLHMVKKVGHTNGHEIIRWSTSRQSARHFVLEEGVYVELCEKRR